MAWHLSREDLLRAVQGEPLQKGDPGGRGFSGVGTDSRKPLAGQVFFALKGPAFDGHDFLSGACRQGAAGLVIHNERRGRELLSSGILRKAPAAAAGAAAISIIKVPDTLKALQDLAVFWRKKLGLKIIAVTGSCGKTTVKSFAKTLISPERALAGPKSWNNHWGVPLSILSAESPGSVLIQEIGTSRPGEIAALTALCGPEAAAVTMAGPSHLEGFGSVEAVAGEKKQIYIQSPGAAWVFNRDCPWTEKMFQELAPKARRVLSFSSRRADADVRLRLAGGGAFSSDVEGVIGRSSGRAGLGFSGESGRDNLMCAAGLALAAGVSPGEIWSRLPLCRLPPGRQQWLFVRKPKKLSVLFDGCNANPASMEAFLKVFGQAAPAKKRFLALGDMRELGRESARRHRALAEHPALLGSAFVWHIGSEGGELEAALREKSFKGGFFRSKAYRRGDLSRLAGRLKDGDFIGIKGSRSLRLERLLFDLTGQNPLC